MGGGWQAAAGLQAGDLARPTSEPLDLATAAADDLYIPVAVSDAELGVEAGVEAGVEVGVEVAVEAGAVAGS
jgi:hypothetical protein